MSSSYNNLRNIRPLRPGDKTISAKDANAVQRAVKLLSRGISTGGHGTASINSSGLHAAAGEAIRTTEILRVIVNNNDVAPMSGFVFKKGTASGKAVSFYPSIVGHLPFVAPGNGEATVGLDISDLFPRISLFDVLWIAKDDSSDSPNTKWYTLNVYTHWRFVEGSDPNVDCCT